MSNYLIRFTVKYTSDVNNGLEDTGYVCERDLGKAAARLEEYYGNDLLEITCLRYASDESGVYILHPDTADLIEEELN